mmetsp:Transcript_34834/g.82641  ORF Transcript_34834/g.82641 Transcript_34834/m.82641 type:complete len:203 (+) Transcript_34834:1136-1744(+)
MEPVLAPRRAPRRCLCPQRPAALLGGARQEGRSLRGRLQRAARSRGGPQKPQCPPRRRERIDLCLLLGRVAAAARRLQGGDGTLLGGLRQRTEGLPHAVRGLKLLPGGDARRRGGCRSGQRQSPVCPAPPADEGGLRRASAEARRHPPRPRREVPPRLLGTPPLPRPLRGDGRGVPELHERAGLGVQGMRGATRPGAVCALL